ncbi:MAG: hypothetical protein K0U72_05595 [Gammaproteobacteria bacterium]|nr:hypothetical protein [Gammaproteobacteria bacterium]
MSDDNQQQDGEEQPENEDSNSASGGNGDGVVPIQISGNWIGNVYGTNVGNASVKIEQDDSQISGEARFMDEAIGPTTYKVSGTAGEKVELKLEPSFVPENVESGEVTVSLELGSDGRLHGEWTSEIGTGGVLTLKRYHLPSETGDEVSSQPSVAPTRVYNASQKIGAVRLGREELRQLISVVKTDFSQSDVIVTYTPKGGSRRTEHAATLLADTELSEPLESITIGIQESEPNNINRGVTVELVSEGDSSVSTFGSVESWVVGKAETVTREVTLHQRSLVTGYKRRGLDFNFVIFLIAIAFLPSGNSYIRAGYLAGAVLIILFLRFLHTRVVPMTVIELGPSRPGFRSRVGAPLFSWAIAVASAVAIKVLSDVLSDSEKLLEIGRWVSNLFGLDVST